MVLGLAGSLAGCDAGLGAYPSPVLPGIEVLLADSMHLVANRRMGLVTNQAGVGADGVHDVERLRAAGVDLVALFSPEHGFRGAAPPGAEVAHTVDSATGLPIYSLYGETSAPTSAMLEGIDVLVVDLQDAGARYYTYLWTTVEVMRAAARERDIRGSTLPVLVLDRPNPIGGLMQGNVLDTAYASPVGLLAVPMRHGLTLGELSRLAVRDLDLEADLTVVPLQGWSRARYFDELGLPFTRPSPNLQTMESLLHYPGLCLFEGTALSVGRGSNAPFEQIGAPWLDTAAVLAGFEQAGLEGVTARPVRFRPDNPGDGKYPDTTIAGLRLQVTDRAAYDPVGTAVTLLAIIARRHPDVIGWSPAHFDRLAGGATVRTSLMEGRTPAEIMRDWPAALARFRDRAGPVILY